MKTNLLVLLTAMTLAACAKSGGNNSDQSASLGTNSDSEIIGGESVNPIDPIAKTVVAIFDTEQKSLCTGSILSASLVVTAGHCFNADPTKLVLIFGTQLPSAAGPKPVVRRVVDGRVNPRYTQVNAVFEKNHKLDPDSIKEWGDISVLKFAGGLPPGFFAARVLNISAALKNGALVTLAGYGEINGPQHTPADRLRKVNVSISNAQFAPSEIQMDQRQGKGACHGDSGGPAYINIGGQNFLFGVTSRGSQDKANDCSQFAIYTSILGQMKWLVAQTNALAAAKTKAKIETPTAAQATAQR